MHLARGLVLKKAPADGPAPGCPLHRAGAPPPARRAARHALQEEGVDIVLSILEEVRFTFGDAHVTGHPPFPLPKDGGPVPPFVGASTMSSKGLQGEEGATAGRRPMSRSDADALEREPRRKGELVQGATTPSESEDMNHQAVRCRPSQRPSNSSKPAAAGASPPWERVDGLHFLLQEGLHVKRGPITLSRHRDIPGGHPIRVQAGESASSGILLAPHLPRPVGPNRSSQLGMPK